MILLDMWIFLVLEFFFSENMYSLVWHLWSNTYILCASLLLFETVQGYLQTERAKDVNLSFVSLSFKKSQNP